MASIETQDGVAAVNRAFSILAALAAVDEPSTLAEIAQATGLYKSTILRLMTSLEVGGYAVRMRDGRYGLGASAFRLGLAYERQNPLRQHVLPVLKDLVEHGTESSSFHVLHGPGTRLCLFRVNSSHSTLDRVEAGNVMPLERGAAGRVLLAYSGDPDPAHEALRRDGYTLSRGERDPACCGLAAPVFGPTGEIAGAISLSGPGERFTDSAITHMRDLLLKASAQLTHSLGGPIPTRPPLAGKSAGASRPKRQTA
ncbi:IclR family transcriptional regulator [Roseixanthobacter liquoris]|uniref:IclR family transcriptional regulator n=1 Tax=Roseixanthobacter liquoris TaxID=3119921 RepID=UPI003727FACA